MADRPKVLFTPPLLRYSEVVLTGVIFVPERLAVTVAASYGELLQLPQVATGRQFWLRLAAAVVIPAAFAVLALRLRAVTKGGALAGMVAACCIFVFAGPPGFLVLATVFALTTLATRVGYSRKQHLGTAEGRRGRRASQVLANLSIAALASIGGISEHYSWLLACMVAALAEAAADTVSSEWDRLGATAYISLRASDEFRSEQTAESAWSEPCVALSPASSSHGSLTLFRSFHTTRPLWPDVQVFWAVSSTAFLVQLSSGAAGSATMPSIS